jgi:hypothetical protein
MSNLKSLNGAKDLSNLAKTPGEKMETQALDFIAETRGVIVAMAEQIAKLTQAVNELYMRTDYLGNELSKLKGEDLTDERKEDPARKKETVH